MTAVHKPDSEDTFDLARFLTAQQGVYEQALTEIKSGYKRTHWMWFIFPQAAGLGYSPTSQYYAIKSIEEAKAYLNHPVLGPRLRECAEAALAVMGPTALEIFDSPDDMKLRSCATLFATVAAESDTVFDRLLEKYFEGQRDGKTLQILDRMRKAE